MAIAKLQKFSEGGGCIRVWDRDDAEWIDPYQWACAVATNAEFNRASLHGMPEPLHLPRQEAVEECLRRSGFLFVEFERVENDEIRISVKRL